jgi:hypothetical protein
MLLPVLLLWFMTVQQRQPDPNVIDAIIDGYIEGTVIDPQGKPVEARTFIQLATKKVNARWEEGGRLAPLS